ncbi:hypothetical protein HNV11_11855 [Spirosoma taeanense]|uniref:Uncharacterized protein n=1 Tax=Spirosoma taeanense TaxID=2735870 RepID=A0A6M5Y9S6_9BACT|nr:hypothetical protein [Spirosoma taeanense]QJW90020.1 hypothetical protein HNV11_11855 [Spirosoma taeanense]
MKRYSVLYLLQEQYHHIGCTSYAQARTVLQTLLQDSRRTPVGIYDAKTELFEWEPGGQQAYNQASIEEQSRQAEQVITIAQAIRCRKANLPPVHEVQRPVVYA